MAEELDNVVFSESVKINIGDFESRDFFCSYKTMIKDGEDFDAAFKRARAKVRKKIMSEEKKCRIHSREFVDFDTKAKLR